MPLLILLSAALLCLRAPSQEPAAAPDAHARMLAALAEVRRETASANAYLGDAALGPLRAELEQLGENSTARERFRVLRRLAALELRLGDEARAIERLQAALDLRPVLGRGIKAREYDDVRLELALAWMRLAETQNCVEHHTSQSCIYPIEGGGVHVDPKPARRARAILGALLKKDPRDPTVRWLYHLSGLTLGLDAEQVPEELRLPADGILSRGVEFPRFEDVAPELGLNDFSLSGGLIVDDFDGDHLFDVVVSAWDPAVDLRFYAGRPGGRFEERSEEAGFAGIGGGLNLKQADFEGDGDLDVLVLRGAWLGSGGRIPNSLLANDGSGRFRDVSFDVGLGEVHRPTQTAEWSDIDRDGDLDLYVGNEHSASLGADGQLFLNSGDGNFTDVAAAAGVTNRRFAKGVSFGDIDADGFPDLYVSNLNQPNRLYHNLGDGRFEDVARERGVDRPLASFPCWFFDYDNDGALDLYVSSYVPDIAPVAAQFAGRPAAGERSALFRGDGRGGFEDVALALGLERITVTMGSNFGDLDGDGYLDMYLGTGYPGYEGLMPNIMYRNRAGLAFDDVTTAGGFGHLQKGHAIAFADYDGDGDQDVFAEMGGAFPGDAFGNALFRNPGHGPRAAASGWLALELEGVRSNRRGVGARVSARVASEGVEARSIERTVGAGGSFGANPLRLYLGLGAADALELLEVRWPSGSVDRIEHVAGGRLLLLVEGSGELRTLATD